ncbi:hypothetical protein J4H86_09320 [Spiractinospora alimapuensis]|uniref:DUF4352 domain-containing protein n=1 Tax=Spiractinospora alimapuensis TaxID=2820884 RepID=UPI001F18620A|nr:DUF4352 domain-containing protein [Spiractinospora alimapuensis]QVQ53885.1 hypothetical protein J4H86_09320 [Spiractinospora alimapuensis]
MDRPGERDAAWSGRRHRLGVLVGTACVAMLCVVVAVVLLLTGDGSDPDRSAKGVPTVSPAPQPLSRQPTAADTTVVSEAHEGIHLSARTTQFTPSAEASLDRRYTSVWVRVANDSDIPLSVEASAFFLAGADGTAHDPALGVDVREIADGGTVSLAPGDEMVGVVTALGDFQPGTLSYYPDNSGIPVVEEVGRE